MKELERIYQLVANEEYVALAKLEQIKNELEELGTEQKSIIIKTIKGKKYYYEQWREKEKICCKCLGQVYPGSVFKEEEKIQQKKELIRLKKEQEFLVGQLQRIKKSLERERKEEKLLLDYTFEVFWKDEITARVYVKSGKVQVARYCEHPVKQLFAKEQMTRYQLNRIFEMRCFEKGRGDIHEILKNLGLTEYNPYEIVRKTHGVSYNDYIWFRFPGENITARDVLVR